MMEALRYLQLYAYCLIATAMTFVSVKAFQSSDFSVCASTKISPTPPRLPRCVEFMRTTSSLITLQMARNVPEIENWTILGNGKLRGIIWDHPYMEDGDVITTSPLFDPDECTEYSIVETKSGSKYLIGEADATMKRILARRERRQSKIESKLEFAHPLSGKSVGNGQYLLVGRPSLSTSGKSEIWNAYKAGPDGNPIVNNMGKESTTIKVKLSDNTQALLRENANYDRVTTNGLFNGKFVEKLDFFPMAQSNSGMEDCSALVIESGMYDLRKYLLDHNPRGLSGKEMRDVACSAGKCLQAIHASKLVWTDLKTENFVLTCKGVRGIDLESAIRVGGHPVDYSPEASPPEFAEMLTRGLGTEFIVHPSYDMWSLGMLLYELSTGASYFEGMSPNAITSALSKDDFVVDVSAVKDANLRHLIQSCLSPDPQKRPDITQYLNHPYFTTTGIGPFGFFWIN